MIKRLGFSVDVYELYETVISVCLYLALIGCHKELHIL